MTDFWSRRLGGTSPPMGNSTATPSALHPQLPVTHNWSPPPATPQGNPKAPSSLSNRSCPECASSNYTGGQGSTMTRCYDCGYNPRFGQQSGAGGLPADKSSPARAARQVSTENNYQPMTVIGRIDG